MRIVRYTQLLLFGLPVIWCARVSGQELPISQTTSSVCEVVKAVPPVFSPLALAARVSGQVVVEVHVAGSGAVASVNVIDGHSLLRDSALIAARKWQFADT